MTTPRPETPARVEEPTSVICAHWYLADLLERYAFVFLLPGTGQRFTLYTVDPARYTLGGTYTLSLTPTDPPTSNAGADPGGTGTAATGMP